MLTILLISKYLGSMSKVLLMSITVNIVRRASFLAFRPSSSWCHVCE